MRKLFYGFLAICILFIFVGCEQNNINNKSNIGNSMSSDPPLNLASSVNHMPMNGTSGAHNIEQQEEEGRTVYLEITNNTYTLQADTIPYTIMNSSGKEIWVVLAPLLERETDSGWESVAPVGVGFCGTPDQIDSQYNGNLPLSWYADSLIQGRYRLSFEMVENNNYESIATISAYFVLSDFDVIMAVKENNSDSKGATLVLTNISEYEYNYGEHYTIEKKSEDNWENVDTVIQNYAFHDIGYGLGAKQTLEIDVNWEWLYGELDEGKYRITKSFSFIRSPGDHDTYHLSAEFIVP